MFLKTVVFVISLVLPSLTSSPRALSPWAAFNEKSWIDIHTHHEMLAPGLEEPSIWDSDSRLTIGKTRDNAVTLIHNNPKLKVVEKATLPVPPIDSIAGTRALGQWPHDIFPFGPERKEGLTVEQKNPRPFNIHTRQAGGTREFKIGDRTFNAVLHIREWDANTKTGKVHFVLKAWTVAEVELPLHWEYSSSDGSLESQTDLVSLGEDVNVAGKKIRCLVTVTKKKLDEGIITKKRWSTSEVPGFVVKMESSLKTREFSLKVNEWVSAFHIAGTP